MKENNRGFNAIVIILVVVCIFQGFMLADVNEQLENMDATMSEMNSYMNGLKYRISELESVVDTEGIPMETSYTVSDIEWEKGVVKVKFSIHMNGAADNTRLVLDNSYQSRELTKNGGVFEGTLEYPIDANTYCTMVYQYEGDYEKANETIDWLGAGTFLVKTISCEFDGFFSYSNNRITMAGTLDYGFNIAENIKSVRLVSKDTSLDLPVNKKGSVEVNLSESIEVSQKELEEGTAEFQQVYVEIKTEEGTIYKVYPALFGGASYQIGADVEMVDGSGYICQENILKVSLPDGKQYEVLLME